MLPKIQLRILTLIVLLIVAGIMMGLNFKDEGWPLLLYQDRMNEVPELTMAIMTRPGFDPRVYTEKSLRWMSIIVNGLLALNALIASGIFSEWLLRRKENARHHVFKNN